MEIKSTININDNILGIDTKQKNSDKNKFELKKYIEKFVELLFLLSAFVSIVCVLAITLFIFLKGFPAITKIGLFEFIFGTQWLPDKKIFGIFPMIIASVGVTFGSILIGVPIGILTAVFISEYAPDKVVKLINPAVELLSGIPSVVYGFFGVMVIVPFISSTFGGAGNSLLAAAIILGIMILPTIISITKTTLNSIPKEYKEGSIALGASKEQTIFKVILPAGKSGILSGIVLGIGRAIGETMAVILIAGNSAIIPKSILDPVRTLTANISLEMGYATGLHQQALFATGVILFVFIMILNLILTLLSNKVGENK